MHSTTIALCTLKPGKISNSIARTVWPAVTPPLIHFAAVEHRLVQLHVDLVV